MKKKILSIVLFSLLVHPTNAKAFSNGDIAEALAYSGCTWGMILEPNQFGMEQSVRSSVRLGLNYRIIDEGLSVPAIEKSDTPKGRTGYNHLLQSWATAGILSSRWKSLESTYEKGMQAGIKKWNSGATLGFSNNSATAVSVSKLTGPCRVAEIGVKAKANKTKLTIRQYVIKVTGGYLPPLP
jgi:hypothetical protein